MVRAKLVDEPDGDGEREIRVACPLGGVFSPILPTVSVRHGDCEIGERRMRVACANVLVVFRHVMPAGGVRRELYGHVHRVGEHVRESVRGGDAFTGQCFFSCRIPFQ